KPRPFSLNAIVLRPLATFFYNYFVRLGFLDGREGLLLHMYHAGYVSWKYAKAWEMGRPLPQAEQVRALDGDPKAGGAGPFRSADEQSPGADRRRANVNLPR